MNKKNKEKLTVMKRQELQGYLADARLELVGMKLDWQAGRLNRYHEIIKARQTIAYCQTLIRQKDLEGENK